MRENEIIQRILDLCQQRSWSVYRLAKESGLTYSTLCTMLHKANAPSLSTLDHICDGFGITMGAFFGEDHLPLTKEEETLLERWQQLSEEDRAAAWKYIEFLSH